MEFQLERFIEAQDNVYSQALSEVGNGRKVSHWMWFIFPQLKGLGSSSTALFYGIDGLVEATAYFNHPVLGKRLVEISETLLKIKGRSANSIFGTPDDLKLKSSMTLFSKVENADPVFKKVLRQYFDGKEDLRTVQMLDKAH